MRIGDRLVVLASEERGVMVGVTLSGDIEVLLDGESLPRTFSPTEVDVCLVAAHSGYRVVD
jgi:hypothetical protein